jgi:parallel beta helix pectate lyase-like protein
MALSMTTRSPISVVRRCLCLLAVYLATVARVGAATYYVSANGSDAASGDATSPWRTLAAVNNRALQPGDAVLLRGGDTFAGGLSFDAGDAGSASLPIVITSYGTGRATIASGATPGISIYNAAGYRISNLALVGNGGAASGLVFFNDLSGSVKLRYIRIDSVEVSGYGRDGIEIGSWNGASGYQDVQIVNAVAHDNARTGIFVYAQQPNVHQSVTVLGARAFNNPGLAGTATNSGSGIILSGVNGGVIERSVAHSNGWRCDAPEGPVGIWAYDSTQIRIRHNESYGNRTGGSADGGGFDLDQNVSMSIVEYNYSHDNDGAGYLLAHAPSNDLHYGNVVRFNISQNDGRRNSYAAIEIWGRIRSTEIYNNTVFMSAATVGTPRVVRVGNAGITDRDVDRLHFRNNIFQTSGSVPFLEVTAGQLSGANDLRFQGNDYFSGGSPFTVLWGGTSYASLTAWRATGQEVNGTSAVGTIVDPMLTAPGGGVTFDDATRLETLDAYRLKQGSPLVNAGLNLSTLYAIDAGSQDFYGTALDGTFDVGACELATSQTTSADIILYAKNADVIAGAWVRVSDVSAAGSIRLRHPDAGQAKLATPLGAPANYFELTFSAEASTPYRLWVRGKADADLWSNDSVFVQFSDSLEASGAAQWRIGTTSATSVNVEDCSGCGLSGWGWQDNGYGAGVLGPLVRFANSGTHTLRIQTREDGLSIDQVVLSPLTYLTASPGALRNDTTILPLPSTPTPSTPEVVIYASDIAASAIHGDWSRVSTAGAAGGVALLNPDRGLPKIASPSTAPTSYVDVQFQAERGVPYHLWLRLRASANASGNDSVYVQFSGAIDAGGAPLYRVGTPSGASVILQDFSGAPLSAWGWNDNGWASFGSPVYFAASGTQTLRLQPREDGVYIDQIVLSPRRYLDTSPGALTNDTTIVSR